MFAWIPTLTGQTLSVADLLAGFGGWSTAAGYAGLLVRYALNHWQYAVDIHAENHPGTNHYCDDLFVVHPRMFPHTDLLIASPTCTYFTQAREENVLTLVQEGQLHLFKDDQEAYEKLVARHQGRHTMFGVLKFIEYHRYHYGILENVVEVRKWSLFPTWCERLRNLGYEFKFLYLNSMFFHSLNGGQSKSRSSPRAGTGGIVFSGGGATGRPIWISGHWPPARTAAMFRRYRSGKNLTSNGAVRPEK